MCLFILCNVVGLCNNLSLVGCVKEQVRGSVEDSLTEHDSDRVLENNWVWN
jgi:hypothetical protein